MPSQSRSEALDGAPRPLAAGAGLEAGSDRVQVLQRVPALAGKAYSSAANRAYLPRRGIRAVTPVNDDHTANRRKRGPAAGRPPASGTDRHKDPNTAGRCFNKLKTHQAVATRHSKRERIYLGTIDVASIWIWLRDPAI